MSSSFIQRGIGHTLFSFDGRLARGPYWLFGVVAPMGALIALTKLSEFITGIRIGGSGALDGVIQATNVVVLLVVLVSALWILLATGTKRLHDRNLSGWWIWVVLVPYIGWLVLFFFFVQIGTQGENEFGPEPSAWGT